MPLFTTTTQFVALALVLVAGWLLGLASHPGGKKWRDRYTTERDAHAANRRAAEQRHANDQARIAEVERENARLAKAAPVTHATITRSAAVPARPLAPVGQRPGWFDWNRSPAR